MGIAKVKNPDNIECTLEFTMRLSDWKNVKKTLSSHPAYAETEVIVFSDFECPFCKKA